ncbi:unnamed protein product [Lampetra planeri]
MWGTTRPLLLSESRGGAGLGVEATWERGVGSTAERAQCSWQIRGASGTEFRAEEPHAACRGVEPELSPIPTVARDVTAPEHVAWGAMRGPRGSDSD